MKRYTLLFSSILLLLVSGVSRAQSMYEDVKTLAAASKLLEERDYQLNDHTSAQAYAQVLAILYEYDQSALRGLPPSHARLSRLPQRYRNNPRISNLLRMDSLTAGFEAQYAHIASLLSSELNHLESGERRRMMALLQGEHGASPAEYLSVSRALQRHRIPPVESLQNLQVLAASSNQNVQGGIVNPQAVLTGVFNFVLQRAQEEIVINFMDRFLNEDMLGYEDIFPTVYKQFNQVGFTYSQSFLERLRDALYQDVQLLGVRLPIILMEDERFRDIQEDPVVFNLLAVYSMIGMAQAGTPLEEIIPLTHRSLYENYMEAQKKVNFDLATSSLENDDYQQLIAQSRQTLQRINQIYLLLNEGENALQADMQQLQEQGAEIPDFAALLKPAYRLEVIMGGDSVFRLNLLPSLLSGHLDTAYVLGFRSVQAYDKYFGVDRSPEQWRAAGIELARNLNGTWYNDQRVDQVLRDWATDLRSYKETYDRWKRSLKTDEELMNQALAKLEEGRVALQSLIVNTKAFWSGSLQGNQGLRFDMLSGILSESLSMEELEVQIEVLAIGEENFLEQGLQMLEEVEARLLQLNEELALAYPDQQTGNPVHAYMANKQPLRPYGEAFAQIDALREDLFSLQQQLNTLERTQARQPYKRMENAQPLLQVTETLSHLFYCLRSSDSTQVWMSKEELNELLNEPELRDAFLGLLYQRLSQVQGETMFSPEGLANLVQLTVGDLPQLLQPDTLENGKSLALLQQASFVVNTLTRVLEIPLVVSQQQPDLVQPLSQVYPQLGEVPEVSSLLLNLLYNLNIEDHRRAMSSAIRLFIKLDSFNVEKPVGDFLEQYGYFMADLIDAESTQEVESLLYGIADPPGSSRLKRSKRLTVGLNAYLGASGGLEGWSQSSSSLQEDFLFMAPTIPIGITMSRLFGDPTGKPVSLSLFIGFLDLGSMLTLQGGSEAFGESVLTFRNMFKPSVQMQWNLPKSPFYLGTGVQVGPHIQEIGGVQQSIQSTRFFLSFGVDVPVKTFFVR